MLGSLPACAGGDASSSSVLIRGCDPVMAERANSFLPKLIGNAQIESATDDNGASPACKMCCVTAVRSTGHWRAGLIEHLSAQCSSASFRDASTTSLCLRRAPAGGTRRRSLSPAGKDVGNPGHAACA